MISIPEKWLFWRQMCWSFSSFVIKSGCTSKESWDCGDTMLSSGERRKKPTGTQSLKFCDKTWPVQNRRLKGFHYSVLHSLEPMSFSVVTAWALDFQNFKNCIWDLEENTRVWQELGSWTFLFLNLRIVVLVLKKRQWLSKHCHQRCYWEFGDLSFQQTLSANPGDAPSKVNYVLCLLVAECSSGSSDQLCAIPSAYRSGTWIFAHGDGFCHLITEEDIIPVDHCDLGGVSSESSWCGLHLHSCPVPPRFNTAFCSEVQLLKPNSWSCFITTKVQLVP